MRGNVIEGRKIIMTIEQKICGKPKIHSHMNTKVNAVQRTEML